MEVKNLVQTCSACPSQWNFKTFNDHNVYVRYRYGCLKIYISEKPNGNPLNGHLIHNSQLGDEFDGCLDWEVVSRIVHVYPDSIKEISEDFTLI